MSDKSEWLKQAKIKQAELKMAEKESRPKGQKCSNCKHHRGHEFSQKYHYCRLGTSAHTPNGFAKTNASAWCSRWEESK